MFKHFIKYFFFYICRAKTRQRLLFLAIIGLILSSFSLLVLQSTMGGLQHKLMERSKGVGGHGVLFLNGLNFKQAKLLNQSLRKQNYISFLEYEVELLLRYDDFVAPAMAHGLDESFGLPAFFDIEKLDGLAVASELAYKIKAGVGDKIGLISPAHVDSFMGDIPRMTSAYIGELLSTSVPEVDNFHFWISLPALQNLAKKRVANRIRLYNKFDPYELKKYLAKNFKKSVRLETWEEQNKTLVWALSLETTVMLFLFIAMTMLVSLCITSGLLIFFDKIETDMASFWILGASQKKLHRASALFLSLMSLFSVLVGIAAALIFLFLLDHYSYEFMPDVFVDRKIPIYITAKGLLISFIIPYGISLIFSYFSLAQFKKDLNYLEHTRSMS